MTGEEFDCSDFEWTRDIQKKVEKTINTIPRERKQRSGKTETEQATKTKDLHRSQGIIKQTRGENKLSESEKANWMDWNYDDENRDDEDRLIHGLYTLIPTRRLEYGLLCLARRKTLQKAQQMDKKFNYIVTDKKK